MHITSRVWEFDDGGSAADTLVRRVFTRQELDSVLATAGWEGLPAVESRSPPTEWT